MEHAAHIQKSMAANRPRLQDGVGDVARHDDRPVRLQGMLRRTRHAGCGPPSASTQGAGQWAGNCGARQAGRALWDTLCYTQGEIDMGETAEGRL